jgi:hypothetical protein
VTFFEHAMVGGSLGLAGGLHRRFGWHLIALAAFAAMLPDWDGLTILAGAAAYERGHRVWGHNLFVASLLGALVGLAGFAFVFSHRCASARGRLGVPTASPPPATSAVWLAGVWMVTGLLASLSHLPPDVVYCSGAERQDFWPIKFLWPFSDRAWGYPTVAYGDLGATVVFVVQMFALYRWPARAQLIAWLTLITVVAYVGFRWTTGYAARR